MAIWTSFLIAFSVILPLINPLGSALVLLGLIGSAPPAVYRRLARKIAINNVIFLVTFELLGATILNFFGISLPIVQLSGGIVIAAMGWGVLNERDASAASKAKKQESQIIDEDLLQSLDQKAFYPFTFPVTSGPGTLVALLTVTARISTKDVARDILAHVGVFIAILVLSALVYFSYAYAPKITKVIPPSTAQGVLRIMGFILLCIGVQIAWNGFSALLKAIIKS